MTATPLSEVIESLEFIHEQASDQQRYFKEYVVVGEEANGAVMDKVDRKLSPDDLPYGEELERIEREEVLKRLRTVTLQLEAAIDDAVAAAQGRAPDLSKNEFEALEKLAEDAEETVREINGLRDDLVELHPDDVRRYGSENGRW